MKGFEFNSKLKFSENNKTIEIWVSVSQVFNRQRANVISPMDFRGSPVKEKP